jgi:hypothetical protein
MVQVQRVVERLDMLAELGVDDKAQDSARVHVRVRNTH